MKLLVLVLNKTECLEEILEKMGEQNLKGATILDSKGMAHSLSEFSELRFMASLRMILDPEHQESKTIFMVLEDKNVELVSKIVNKATGGLDKPDTGVLFTLPVDYTEGISK